MSMYNIGAARRPGRLATLDTFDTDMDVLDDMEHSGIEFSDVSYPNNEGNCDAKGHVGRVIRVSGISQIMRRCS